MHIFHIPGAQAQSSCQAPSGAAASHKDLVRVDPQFLSVVLHPQKYAVAVLKGCGIGSLDGFRVIRENSHTASVAAEHIHEKALLFRDSVSITAVMEPQKTCRILFLPVLTADHQDPENTAVASYDRFFFSHSVPAFPFSAVLFNTLAVKLFKSRLARGRISELQQLCRRPEL